MRTTLHVVGATLLIAVVAAFVTAAIPHVEWVETWQWDESVEKYSSDTAELTVRGWPLFFIVHSPRGGRLLWDPLLLDTALFSLPSFLVAVISVAARRRKARSALGSGATLSGARKIGS